MAARSIQTSEFVTVSQIAARLGVGTSWLYERIRSGQFELPVLKVGKQYRVSRRALEQWLATAEADSEPAA